MTDQHHPPQKRSRLTLYIIIGLIAGIALGFVLNITLVKTENLQLAQAEDSLATVKQQLLATTDTTTEHYATLIASKTKLSATKNAVLEARNNLLDPFSLIADIFLRLIKMIVAPLVFTTLVVGVAKLGDINSVGRIGGKTLLWFLTASFTSLLLGMALVNLFKPGVAMHLPIPEVADTGIQKTALSLKDFLYHVFPASFIERNGQK